MFSGDHRSSHRRRRVRTLLLVAAVSTTTWISGTAVRADTVVVPDPDGPRGGHAIQDLRVANDGPLVTATVRHRSADWRGTVRIELDPTPGVADAKYMSVIGHRTGRGASFTRADGSSWVCEGGDAHLPPRRQSHHADCGSGLPGRSGPNSGQGHRGRRCRPWSGRRLQPSRVAAGGRLHGDGREDHGPASAVPGARRGRDGEQSGALYKSNTTGTWNLRGAVWRGLSYPVRSESWTQGCVEGGVVHGPIPRAATRDTWYDGIGGTAATGEGLRVTMTKTAQSWVAATDMFVEDMEDAYDPNAADATARTYLDHVRAEHIRDDCIENEDPVHHMYVTNSFFDGCFTAFAERPPGSTSAQNGTTPADFVVENSLVHVTPNPWARSTAPPRTSRVAAAAPTAPPGSAPTGSGSGPTMPQRTSRSATRSSDWTCRRTPRAGHSSGPAAPTRT